MNVYNKKLLLLWKGIANFRYHLRCFSLTIQYVVPKLVYIKLNIILHFKTIQYLNLIKQKDLL